MVRTRAIAPAGCRRDRDDCRYAAAASLGVVSPGGRAVDRDRAREPYDRCIQSRRRRRDRYRHTGARCRGNTCCPHHAHVPGRAQRWRQSRHAMKQSPKVFGAKCVLDVRARLGECPVWSVREQVLYWVDIHAARLHRFDPARAHDSYIQFQEEIGCVGLRRDGGFIAGMRSGVWLLDAEGRRERMIDGSALEVATRRYNDGRCDRAGRFWVGTIYEPRDRAAATLYRIGPTGTAAGDSADFTCTPMAGGITVSN